MDIFSIFTLGGGLAFFLFGMELMSDGLKKSSGSRLEHILEKLTNNKLMAILLGALVTAIIQSSSATTVMVVGFVNSGIMNLTQAVGVIFGANIGTTITAWILSTTQISGESFFLQLLKPSSFAPLLLLIGVVLMMSAKRERNKNIGTILAGFGMLMVGMETMSTAMEPLAENPHFAQILVMVSNPILGLIVGTCMSALIQSSSAVTGILQALSLTGAVNWGSAMPILLGSEIGTSVTGLLSSTNANRSAKRTALIQLYFNAIVSIAFVIVFYSINKFVNFEFLNNPIDAVGIALFNTLINVGGVAILSIFMDFLIKLTYLSVPETEEEREELKLKENDELKLLDERFLSTPKYALDQTKNVINSMANYSKESLFMAIDLLANYDKKKYDKVVEIENLIDHYDDEVGTYLVKLSSQNLTEEDGQRLSVLIHSIGDFERISDHAVNIAETADLINQKGLSFSDEAIDELKVFTAALEDIVTTTFDIFETKDIERAHIIEAMEELMDYLSNEIKRHHLKRLQKGKCNVRMSFVLSDIATNFERISDHCSNIGLNILALEASNYETHEAQIELSGASTFKKDVETLKEKYQLPDYHLRELETTEKITE